MIKQNSGTYHIFSFSVGQTNKNFLWDNCSFVFLAAAAQRGVEDEGDYQKTSSAVVPTAHDANSEHVQASQRHLSKF